MTYLFPMVSHMPTQAEMYVAECRASGEQMLRLKTTNENELMRYTPWMVEARTFDVKRDSS